MANDKRSKRSLQERLDSGENVLCAEGYVLGLARRGYVGTGIWTPEFILEYPEVLRSMHYEFVHCGSDVVQALQYYTHKQKMKEVGREGELEKINRLALRIAREIAEETGTLFAGNTCNTNIYKPGDKEIADKCRAMFDDQVRWAKEEKAEFIIAETYHYFGEAEIALDVIKSHGLPSVITFSVLDSPDGVGFKLFDGLTIGEGCKKLLDQGAYLVGVNCGRGPEQTLQLVKEIIKVCPPEKVCALPLGYRTTDKMPNLFALRDKACSDNYKPYPHGLEAFGCAPVEIRKFTQSCMELGLKYMGVCCGNSGMLTNAMATAMGRTTAVSRYHRPDSFGTDVYKNFGK